MLFHERNLSLAGARVQAHETVVRRPCCETAFAGRVAVFTGAVLILRHAGILYRAEGARRLQIATSVVVNDIGERGPTPLYHGKGETAGVNVRL